MVQTHLLGLQPTQRGSWRTAESHGSLSRHYKPRCCPVVVSEYLWSLHALRRLGCSLGWGRAEICSPFRGWGPVRVLVLLAAMKCFDVDGRKALGGSWVLFSLPPPALALFSPWCGWDMGPVAYRKAIGKGTAPSFAACHGLSRARAGHVHPSCTATWTPRRSDPAYREPAYLLLLGKSRHRKIQDLSKAMQQNRKHGPRLLGCPLGQADGNSQGASSCSALPSPQPKGTMELEGSQRAGHCPQSSPMGGPQPYRGGITWYQSVVPGYPPHPWEKSREAQSQQSPAGLYTPATGSGSGTK